MKKGIAIVAKGGKSWIGGLYYMRNMVFQLSANHNFLKKYNIVVFVDKENEDLFLDFSPCVTVRTDMDRGTYWGQLRFFLICMKYNIRFSFPHDIFKNNRRVTPIHWIPDFQHNHYPEFFSQAELEWRAQYYGGFAQDKAPLVLSSEDCKKDFRKYYSQEKENVCVVPFVSYIEKEVAQLDEISGTVLDKYGLTGSRYVLISNQFWRHKNHIIVFQAIGELLENVGGSPVEFVFTGYPMEDRDPEYYKSLMTYMDEAAVKEHVKILGFLDRREQLAIMKEAAFLIQPSLFEGWGTVVEDGKVLDKLILLSDIPVHREQMNQNCVLFDPHDPKALAQKILKLSNIERVDSPEQGIRDMHERAYVYSEKFRKLLDSM